MDRETLIEEAREFPWLVMVSARGYRAQRAKGKVECMEEDTSDVSTV